ncbi:MAG: bifunctional hydroxymethylpyrimidine kinase/phosphomethylpyrimidine kinase [Acidobacteria bacterium]|nr:MAG: bifunctional hydroxymethylpyrimidine kinase/phosphomethylpyrimidine kinase [Acidobacteriota bacterium]
MTRVGAGMIEDQNELPRMLAIGGSDSSGGAGVQADIKTGMALGVEVSTAITALTAQNSLGVQKVAPVSTAMLAAQIDSVYTDIPPTVMKLGMLVDAARIRIVGKALRRYTPSTIVCDPVLVSTSGHTLLNDAGRKELIKLLPLITLLTPNAQEAEVLSGRETHTRDGCLDAGRILLDLGVPAVLLKGGHMGGNESSDVLLLQDHSSPIWFSAARIETHNDHGTGCVLASAIAACLARGRTLVEAIGSARDFVQQALIRSAGLRNGNGRGGMILYSTNSAQYE